MNNIKALLVFMNVTLLIDVVLKTNFKSSKYFNELISGPSIIYKAQNNNDRVEDNHNGKGILHRPSLKELVGSTKNYPCHPDLILFEDHFEPEHLLNSSSKSDNSSHHQIPRIIHITSKTRCLTPAFYKNLQRWRSALVNYTIVLHDDAAVNRLLNLNWPEFPHLNLGRYCITTGAGLADLWRYVVTWQYGGVYTDIDNAPGPTLDQGQVMEGADAFFEREMWGFPSQYFFAVSPRHPIMYYTVHHCLGRLLFEVKNVREQSVPFITGPGAVKAGMIQFINDGYPIKGVYNGTHNRSVTIVSHKDSYLKRSFVGGRAKTDGFSTMNMSMYDEEGKRSGIYEGRCLDLIFEKSNDLFSP